MIYKQPIVSGPILTARYKPNSLDEQLSSQQIAGQLSTNKIQGVKI